MYAGKIIERASARELYAHPRHPYTEGLLRSVPRLDEPRRAELAPIEGQPPDLTRLPPGCAFFPRCRWREARCEQSVPPLASLAEREWHMSACWQAERLGQGEALAGTAS
jgi:oligopeptide/dipeptide ABC transporter ATP-binding protein